MKTSVSSGVHYCTYIYTTPKYISYIYMNICGCIYVYTHGVHTWCPFISQSFLRSTLGAVLAVIPGALLRLVVCVPGVPVLLVPGGRCLLLLLLWLLLHLLLLLWLLVVWSPLSEHITVSHEHISTSI